MTDENDSRLFKKKSADKRDDEQEEADSARGSATVGSLPTHGILHTSPDSPDYNMKLPSLGKVVIFNHNKFDKHLNLNTRTGTDVDRAQLELVFNKLGFKEIEAHNDLTQQELDRELTKLQLEDHTERACLIVCFLSHGHEDGIIYAKDSACKKSKLWETFLGDKCPSLAGKPKIFFIQACQGDKVDSGQILFGGDRTDSITHVYTIPTYADILVMSSSVPGYFSWRNSVSGSWFMQSLCSVLSEKACDTDLLSMMTIVSRHVAFGCISNVPGNRNMDRKKQVPYLTSTLTRRVFLNRNE